METCREFVEDEEHNNWLKVVVAFLRLLKPLRPFIDEQIRNFHEELRERCGANQCVNKCSLKNWKPRLNQVPPLDCEVCAHWKDAIKENLTGGKIMWMNSEPHLWAKEEWEVAKVYMTDSQKNKKSVDQFDIAALLSLMARCKFFKRFSLGNSCEQVAKVGNNIMHSPNFHLKKEDLHSYLQIIRGLGEALAKHDAHFKSLSEDIIVNTECREIQQEIKKAQEAREAADFRQLTKCLQQIQEELENNLELQRMIDPFARAPSGQFLPFHWERWYRWDYLVTWTYISIRILTLRLTSLVGRFGQMFVLID